jgi:hypothetical protein
MSINLQEKNVGQVDKYARIGGGSLLLVLAGTGAIGAWGFIGLVPLATGLLGSCPVYSLLGKSTATEGHAHAHSGGCCGGAAHAQPSAAAEEPAAPAAAEPEVAAAEPEAVAEPETAAAPEAAASEAPAEAGDEAKPA